MELTLCKNLVDAMVSYGLESCWNDSEIIDALVNCGLTEDDFVRCGYEDFVKDYFGGDSDEEDADTIAVEEPMHISEIAYELYKMDWIATHVSRACELSTYREYLKDRNECLKEGEEADCFEEWLGDAGYGNGSLYVCYEEFCDGEYHDRDFVAYLLGYDQELVSLYLEDIKDDYLEEVD